MSLHGLEIHCPACGQDTLLLRQPVYEGFMRVGETFSCASCSHQFPTEADVPFREKAGPVLFTEADRTPDIHVFSEGENEQLCRYCAHYIVNPFTQWCGVHKKEVAATDSCDRFERREEKSADELL